MTFVLAVRSPDGVAMAADGLVHRALEPPEGGAFWIPQAADKVVAPSPRVLVAFAGDLPIVQPVLEALLSPASRQHLAVKAFAEKAATTMKSIRHQAVRRYERLHPTERAELLAPRAQFIVGGIEAKRTSQLWSVDPAGTVLDRTEAGFATAGVSGPYARFAESMVRQYLPPRASMGTAEGFAYSILQDLTTHGFFRILPPVRVWSVSTRSQAREITKSWLRSPPPLSQALSTASRQVARSTRNASQTPATERATLKVKTK